MLKCVLFSFFALLPIASFAEDYEFAARLKGGVGFEGDVQVDINGGCFLSEKYLFLAGVRVQHVLNTKVGGELNGNCTWTTEDDDMYNLLVPVSMELTFPLYTTEEKVFSFFLEPELLLHLFPQDNFTVNYEEWKGYEMKTWSKTYTGRNFHWAYCYAGLNTGFCYNTGYDFSISLGYELSNQDPYKKRRGTELHNVHFGDQMPAKKTLYHHIFLAVSYFM